MINISAAEFAKVVSGKLHLISDEMMINEIPVINSNKAVDGKIRLVLQQGIGKSVVTSDYPAEALRQTLALD